MLGRKGGRIDEIKIENGWEMRLKIIKERLKIGNVVIIRIEVLGRNIEEKMEIMMSEKRDWEGLCIEKKIEGLSELKKVEKVLMWKGEGGKKRCEKKGRYRKKMRGKWNYEKNY